jgi:hypothetical protein
MTITEINKAFEENKELILKQAAEGNDFAVRLMKLYENSSSMDEAAFKNYFISAYLNWSTANRKKGEK